MGMNLNQTGAIASTTTFWLMVAYGIMHLLTEVLLTLLCCCRRKKKRKTRGPEGVSHSNINLPVAIAAESRKI